jgi:hypothetical protein
MSNVLLVDTNFSSGPIYHFLIQSGHNVTVVGSNPQDALAKSAIDYVQLDYSDIEKTNQLIAERNIQYLVPGCNDRSYLVCAELNKDGRFPGIDSLETATKINNKEQFRTFAALHNLPTPRVLTRAEYGTRWPVIVKPVDAFSGRGVTVVREDIKNEFSIAIDRAQTASPTKTCIVEDYVEGQLYSFTAFVQNGEIIADHIVEEHGTANPFVVDTSRVVYNFNSTILENVRKDITIISKKLKLKDGLVHTQFILNGNQYWLIEITRRCPGDMYSQLIELSTGLNYAENYVRPFMRLPFNIMGNDQMKWIMRHTLAQSHECTLGSLSFSLPLVIKKWIPMCMTGDRLRESPYGRIGVIFLEEETEQALNEVFSLTLKRQLYSVALQ